MRDWKEIRLKDKNNQFGDRCGFKNKCLRNKVRHAAKASRNNRVWEKIIINLRESKKPIREIGKIVKRPYSTIKKIIDKYTKTKKSTNEPKCGRPRALSEAKKRFIVREIKKNPKHLATQLTEMINSLFGLNVSANTVRNVLYAAGYQGRVARKNSFISKVNKKKRLEYA